MATGVDDEKSHKRSLRTVLTQLRHEKVDTDKMMGEIKDIVIKTLFTIQFELSQNYKACQPSDNEGLMAFEVLGFDVLIDKNAKPYLLEVNHAPSFATDSPLDYDIKKNLFIDIFTLLNMSVDRKKAKLNALYEEKKRRMLEKMSLKQRQQNKKDMIAAFQLLQDDFEQMNLGRFERILPLPIKHAMLENQKTQDDPKLSSYQKQLANQQYQALVRQQERYTRLLDTMNGSEEGNGRVLRKKKEEPKEEKPKPAIK